jgi:hypothetical protein
MGFSRRWLHGGIVPAHLTEVELAIQVYEGESVGLPKFDELPFNARPDLTPYLIHLTKNTTAEDEYSAFKNLKSILMSGEIWGSDKKKGFIKGPNKAACFMDVPFSALKYVLTPENTDPAKPRYEPYGIILTKKAAYARGCRPVLYLSNDETTALNVPDSELWRVVRFEVTEGDWISWLHEREWRCKGDLTLPKGVPAVLVKTPLEAAELTRDIHRAMAKNKPWACTPLSVIPLEVVCQGLLKPKT